MSANYRHKSLINNDFRGEKFCYKPVKMVKIGKEFIKKRCLILIISPVIIFQPHQYPCA